MVPEVATKLANSIRPMLLDNYALDILTESLLQLEQVDIPVKHLLMPGMYSREIFMPAGSILIGYAHPNDFMEVLVKGKVLMFSDDSETIIEGPFSRLAKAGNRKCGYVLEDTIWITYHPVKAETVEEAEIETIDKTNYYAEDSKKDFSLLLTELGITEEEIQVQMDYTAVLEVTSDDYIINDSSIHGIGIMVTKFLPKDFELGFALFQNMKTTLGRYINHSHKPNSKIEVLENGDVKIITNRSLFKGEEITLDYRKKEIQCLQ